jgi:hypothetical protein
MADQDVTPDPLAPRPGDEGARLLIGILGESPEDDSVRLYLDLEFRKSYDIPTDAIVRREKLSAAQSRLGVESSALWVRPGTVLRLRHSEPRKVEDEFLAGDFTLTGSFQAPEAIGPVGFVRPTRLCTDALCDSDIRVRCSQFKCPSAPPGDCLPTPACEPATGIEWCHSEGRFWPPRC